MADLPPSPLAALEADLRTLIARAATLEKEKAAALDEGKTRTRKLLLEFIEVADTFETLLRQFEAEAAPVPEAAAWVANFRTLYKIHLRALKRHGATPLPSPVGEKVDPHRHQVAEVVTGTVHPPETIVELIKTGWLWHDELLRPAEVKAAAAG